MLDTLVDTFLRGRLGVQLLCDRHGALHCHLADVVEDAVTESRHICDAHFEITLQVLVQIPQDAMITLIRPWVHHALTELLKNALATSVSSEMCPPIYLKLEESNDFTSLCVIDQGAGVSDVEEAFRFASSSAGKSWDRSEEQRSYAMVRSPLQSLGVGLPLSRMLLHHFHGNVTLANISGYISGCTAAIHLNKDATLLENQEPANNGRMQQVDEYTFNL
jgi:pyruvate dehydrogenase kinase 2/3/4